jgi:hypothetical protein
VVFEKFFCYRLHRNTEFVLLRKIHLPQTCLPVGWFTVWFVVIGGFWLSDLAYGQAGFTDFFCFDLRGILSFGEGWGEVFEKFYCHRLHRNTEFVLLRKNHLPQTCLPVGWFTVWFVVIGGFWLSDLAYGQADFTDFFASIFEAPSPLERDGVRFLKSFIATETQKHRKEIQSFFATKPLSKKVAQRIL